MLSELKLHLKRKLISNVFIWKIRHYLQPSWIESYKSKDSSKIVDKILMIDPKSVIDFGCGSGNTLFKIKQSRPEIVVLGVDISSKAISFCKELFSKNFSTGFMFKSKLNELVLKNFLENCDSSSIDIMLFDRVLYCLNSNEIERVLGLIKNNTQNIIIEDFYDENSSNYIGYKHRDWIKILRKFGFKCVLNKNTQYSMVKDANARYMFFKKES